MNLKYKKEEFLFGVKESLLHNSWIKKEYNERFSLAISQQYSLNNNVANNFFYEILE